MHPSLSVDRSIFCESPKLLKESGRQKGKERAGPAVVCCLVLRVIGIIISKQSLGNRKPKKEKSRRRKFKKKKEEGKKLVFLFFRLILFLVMSSSWAKYPVPFAFWICRFPCELWLFGSASNSSSSFS
jgi:hypothetical protein